MEPTLEWINAKFKKNPEIVRANEVALKTGYNFADTTEVFTTHYKVRKAVIAPGKYRKITGNEATAIGPRQRTFTAYFEYAGFDERPYAEAVVEAAGAEPHWITFDDEQLLDDLPSIVACQDGVCGICGKDKRLMVDHDHKTGKVRGLLCSSCNRGLGALGDEEIGLHRAIEYLQRSEEQ